MAGGLPPPRRFTDWIKGILALKSGWSYTEYAASWLAGADMLLRHGTTTVGDIEAVPELLPDVWASTPLRVTSFLELTSVRNRSDPRRLVEEAADRIAGYPTGRSRAGLSPHAPYSTSPELLRQAARWSEDRGWPMAIHVAESSEEFEMFTAARGSMYDWLRWNERDMTDCGRGSPVAHLARLGCLSERLLAVHVNYLAAGDAQLLAERGVHVVHCPRSHEYFGHQPFPLEVLDAAGVGISVGTDSLATVRCQQPEGVRLSQLEEARVLAQRVPRLEPERLLRMLTVHPARALGLAGLAGELGEGTWADLTALPIAPGVDELYDRILAYDREVAGAMIAGRWVDGTEPGCGEPRATLSPASDRDRS
jgi:cytosine/adenosine deaminase-related metal-dependent hydrolase